MTGLRSATRAGNTSRQHEQEENPMGEIALVTTLAIFAVSLAEFGRRAVLGRRMEHAMSRLRTAEFQ